MFRQDLGFSDPVKVPCGRCIGCRLEYSRQWALRCMHEASLHDANCSLTLTYSDDRMPAGGSLVKKHHQDFMKRLRKRAGRLSFFMCGEYDEGIGRRPHYHHLIFGFDFDDKKYFKQSRSGEALYRSPTLEKLWPFGFSTIGSLTFESAAYCARYATKKITGDMAARHYERVDFETGEVHQLVPEFALMSRNPAIGRGWYERFQEDAFPSDFVVARGKEMRAPKYYDKLLEQDNPPLLARLKAYRVAKAKQAEEDSTPERLRVRRVVKEARLKLLKRNLE